MHDGADVTVHVDGDDLWVEGYGMRFDTALGNPPNVDAATGEKGVRDLFEAQAEMIAEHAAIVPREMIDHVETETFDDEEGVYT